MSGFQIVALVLLAFLFVGNMAVVFRGQVSRRVGLPWAAVWLLAAGAIALPGSTRVVAKALGIGRGTDLVLYCFVLIVLMGFYMTYVRLRRVDANLTLLVRHLAIQNAVRGRDEETEPRAQASGKEGSGEATKDTEP